jgi:hypothetical protein
VGASGCAAAGVGAEDGIVVLSGWLSSILMVGST